MDVEIGRTIRRLRRSVWSEDAAAALIGGALAIVAGVVLVYLIG